MIKKANTLQDVEHIRKMSSMEKSEEAGASVATVATSTKIKDGTTVVGVKNITESAGATTLIFMLKKELSQVYGSENVIAVEIDKNDFGLFNDKNMVSAKESDIKNFIEKNSDKSIILIDLNKSTDDSFCGEVLYLLEPSTIKLNKLIKKNKMIFSKLLDKKVILNKSLLLNNDVFDFEKEAGIKVFYNMPPLDERKRNAVINDFLSRLGLLGDPEKQNANANKIFGLFRR